jgi:hypothetical protein
MGRYKEADLNRVRTISVTNRKSRAEVSTFGRPLDRNGANRFLNSLPEYLKANDFKAFMNSVAEARRRGCPFHLMMGAHVIKVGLSPIIIDLMKRRIVTGLSLNSAGLIHDVELAFYGKTSEDVAAGLIDGTFGMARETGRLFAEIVKHSERKSLGLGEAAGELINSQKAKYRKYSLLASADTLGIPATVHVVVGTDIVNQQAFYDAGATAEASYRDFKILANLLIDADCGGAVANIGSAVILPEVFLKALTVARNLKKQKSALVTANFDMITHYRPTMNVVKRPAEAGGTGYNFVGHHEIMIPLLAWGLKAYITKIKK